MPLFARRPPIDLQAVFELKRQPDGSAQGMVDGLSVILERPLKLRIDFPGAWPDEVDILDPPRESRRYLLGRSVRNCSRRRRWMTRAFARPELILDFGALRLGGACLDVEDHALLLRWRSAPDAAQASLALQSSVRLAHALPRAMRDAVNGRTWTDDDEERGPVELYRSLFQIDVRYERKKFALASLGSLLALGAWGGSQKVALLPQLSAWLSGQVTVISQEALAAAILAGLTMLNIQVPCARCQASRAVLPWALFRKAPVCRVCGLVSA